MEPMQPTENKAPEGDRSQYPLSEIVSPWFLFTCVLLTTLAIGFLIYQWTSHFDFTDGEVKIEYMTPRKTRDFDASFAAPVDLGLTIKNFRKFDVPKNQFEIDAMLWFDFDPNVISIHSVSDVSFIRGKILYKSKPVSYAHDGRLFLVYNDVRISFTNAMNYKYFPVDDHRISLGMVNNVSLISELRYLVKNSDFVISDSMIGNGWYQFGQRVQTGYRTIDFDHKEVIQPMALFTIDYGRGRNTRNSLILILPMLMLFFVSLFLFAAKKFDTRLSIPIQSLVGLVAFRFVLESLSPSVGYFMYSDYLFVLFLGLIFILVLIGSVTIVIKKPISELMIILLNLFLVGMFWYLL